MSDEYLRKASELASAGVAYATAVVVRAEKPTSAKPGDRAIVTREGQLFGWIGGSCAQPTVVRESLRALADGRPRLIRLSPEPGEREVPEGVEEMAMTCFSGGTLDIFIEPRHPAPRLLVVGNLPVGRMLVQLGRAMSYRVTAVDPSGGEDMTEADEVLRDIADIPRHVDALTFVVVATHGEYDEPALEAALGTSAPYVGLVASPSRGRAVRAHLAAQGVGDAALARVRFPAGIDIKARDGGEIAVSILAEIIEVRQTLPTFAEGAVTDAAAPTGKGDDVARSAADRSEAADTQRSAVDPVCGMSVAIEGAAHTHDHGGRTYYFCCGGCRARFAANADQYVSAAPA
ncbi:MAG TPA: XdhC family protein [Longimicrobiales bacterium]|nr:XdhC family protein [Longimicrobiales bacterium]